MNRANNRGTDTSELLALDVEHLRHAVRHGLTAFDRTRRSETAHDRERIRVVLAALLARTFRLNWSGLDVPLTGHCIEDFIQVLDFEHAARVTCGGFFLERRLLRKRVLIRMWVFCGDFPNHG